MCTFPKNFKDHVLSIPCHVCHVKICSVNNCIKNKEQQFIMEEKNMNLKGRWKRWKWSFVIQFKKTQCILKYIFRACLHWNVCHWHKCHVSLQCMYVKWWHALETSGMPHLSSACHHFTTYIVVKRDTCINDTHFNVDKPLGDIKITKQAATIYLL